MSFSATEIEAAQPGQTLKDDQVKGLHLRVRGDRKSLFLYYRTKQGKERRPKIGDYGTISIASARRIAKGMLELVAAGRDPVGERSTCPAARTMADLGDEYMTRYAIPEKAPKSAKADQVAIDKHIKGTDLGRTKVADVRVLMIEDLHRSLKGKPFAANRLLALLSKMFNLAEKWEMRPNGSNPCRHVSSFPEPKRDRCLSPDEAAAIVGKLEELGPRYPQQAAFIWLLIYTGARPSEIAASKPEHRKGNVLRLSEHKTARSTKEARVIYLPRRAVAILDALPPANTLLGVKSCRSLWIKILDEAGIREAQKYNRKPRKDGKKPPRAKRTGDEPRPYDLRHTFASIALSQGSSLAQIGKLMGHKNPVTTSRYAHLIDGKGTEYVNIIADAFDQFANTGQICP